MAVVPYLNKRMLYQFQWGYRKEGRSPTEYREWAKDEFRPVLRRMLDIAIRKEILVPQAAYGYWRCAAEGNDVILFDTDGERELTGSHSRARTRKAGSASPISSTMRPTGGRDVIALQVVTLGRRTSAAAREWFPQKPLSGLPLSARPLGRDGRGLAEYLYKRIRGELGFAAEPDAIVNY